METYVANYVQKVKSLIGKLVEGKCRKEFDEQLKKLSTLFSQQEEREVESVLTVLPVLTEWVKEAIYAWGATKITLSDGVAYFTLDMINLLSKREETFCSLNSNNFFIKMSKVLKVRQSTVAPSIKLSYIKLLSTFLEHSSGIEWMIACNFWEDIHTLSLSKQNDDIAKESRRFMSKLLEKTFTVDETFADDVVKKIMFPFAEYIYKFIKATDDVDITCDGVLTDIRPTLQLIGDILEYFLESILIDSKDFDLLVVFLKHFRQEERISDFVVVAQSKCLPFDLGRIIYVMQFLELYVEVVTDGISVAGANAVIVGMKNNFILNMTKGTFENGLNYCNFGQLYWKLMKTKTFVSSNKEISIDCIAFSNQLTIMIILPQYVLLLKHAQPFSHLEELRDNFICKLFNMSEHDFIRVCYRWRDILLQRDDIFEICKYSNARIKESRKYISRESAVTIVQALIFNLNDIVKACKDSPDKLEHFMNKEGYLSEVLEILTDFIEQFEVTWKDSIETIDILTISFEFLILRRWATDVIVLVLKLIRVAAFKYMAPNLALLVDSTADSTVGLIGPLLFANLYEGVVEVKKAALEVVCTLTWISKNKVESYLILVPVLTEWIKKAVFTWNAKKVSPSSNIASFTLTVASLLSKKEETFCNLNSYNFYIKLINVLKVKQPEVPSSIKSSYIKLLSSFLEHSSGIEWTMACNFWEDVYQLSLSTNSEDVVTDSKIFMSKMLERTFDKNEHFTDSVVKKMMLPLGENIYKSIKASNDPNSPIDVASKYLTPSLKLIGDILNYFLEGVLCDGKKFDILIVFLKNFHQEERISDFMMIAQNKCLAFDISKIMLIMQFLELYVKVVTNSVSVANTNAVIATMKNSFIQSISQGTFEHVIDWCDFGQLYWRVMETKLPLFPNNGCEYTGFSDQLVIMEVIPHYVVLLKLCYGKADLAQFALEEFRDNFIQKVVKISSLDFIRGCYHWRDNIQLRDDLFDICRSCNARIKKSRNYITRASAVIVVQALIYILKDIVYCSKEYKDKLQHFVNEVAYMSEVLEIMANLIERFEITWKDSIESIDILSISFEFLMLCRWPARIGILVLKLFKVAIAKYMAPNLALLVDNTSDSTLSLMGPLLFAKMYNEVADVQDAALEVICTMARISNNSKF